MPDQGQPITKFITTCRACGHKKERFTVVFRDGKYGIAILCEQCEAQEVLLLGFAAIK